MQAFGSRRRSNARAAAVQAFTVGGQYIDKLVQYDPDTRTSPPKQADTGQRWELLDEAERTFDLAKQDAILAKLHELVVDEAPWIFIVHDLNPRAMSSKVKGFVPPQSWFVDLTQVSVTR